MAAEKSASSLMTRYQRLIELSRDLASTLELDLLLTRITQAAAELTASEAAGILLYDETRDALFFEASNNMERPIMRGLTVPVKGSIAGWVLINNEPVIVDDPSSDPRFYSAVQQITRTPTLSLLGVPLRFKEQTIGVLEAINKMGGQFTPEDQDVLMSLGAQAAVAIQNARLFTQSDFIAELVHEMRAPLASVKAAIHLLHDHESAEEEREKVIHTIHHEIDRLSALTDKFLDLTRLESGRTQIENVAINIKELILHCAALSRSRIENASVDLETTLPESLPAVSGDPYRLNQLLINLIDNGIKYSGRGGKILVTARFEGDQVHISVQDNGPGIPSESLPHVFEKFYRVPGTDRVAEGSGLGLSIVRRIARAHGGDVSVESELGVGSVFTVRLPISSDEV